MEKEDHKRTSEGKKPKAERLDRHSAMGVDPNPKKGGHNGWGVDTQTGSVEVLDRNDPNFNSDEERKQEEEEVQIEEQPQTN
jgi:hypothetical protein